MADVEKAITVTGSIAASSEVTIAPPAGQEYVITGIMWGAIDGGTWNGNLLIQAEDIATAADAFPFYTATLAGCLLGIDLHITENDCITLINKDASNAVKYRVDGIRTV